MINTLAEKAALLTPPQALVNNASVTVAVLDTLGFNYAKILVLLGAMDIALTALNVTGSDVSGSGYAAITGLDFSVSPATLPSSTSDNSIYAFNIDLLGLPRFLKVVCTVGSGSTGAYVSIIGLLSRGSQNPFTASDRGNAAELTI